MRTCWVIDHPAHFQLFRQWISPFDTLVVTRRPELNVMLLRGFDQPILRVERVCGGFVRKVSTGWLRERKVKRFLQENSVERIISKGAPFELRAAKKMVAERWYISDTEVNKIAHRLAEPVATHILLPDSWTGTLRPTHSYPGILPNAYITPPPDINEELENGRNQSVDCIDKEEKKVGFVDKKLTVFHRRLVGGGIHDKLEIIDYSSVLKELKVDFVTAAEGEVKECEIAWNLPSDLTRHDGVLTGSTTVAAEAAIQGIPTLLISKGRRGFLNVLEPYSHFYQWRDDNLTGSEFVSVRDAWLASMRECRIEGCSPIPSATKSRLIELWGEPVA
jgi:hypothetical protein